MTNVSNPREPDYPDDDLPEVFASLTGIDVIDGELVPRVAKTMRPE